MPSCKAAEPEDPPRDRRSTVLVLIGLCICLPHVVSTIGHRLSAQQQRETELPRLLWLETPAVQGSGLYRLADAARDWPLLLAPRGGAATNIHVPTLDSEPIAAYRLAGNEPAQTIPLPADVRPLFLQPIPINQCSLETLMTIPGIGRRVATAIIDYRDRVGAIKDRTALMSIEGIGAKKAALIEAYIQFD